MNKMKLILFLMLPSVLGKGQEGNKETGTLEINNLDKTRVVIDLEMIKKYNAMKEQPGLFDIVRDFYAADAIEGNLRTKVVELMETNVYKEEEDVKSSEEGIVAEYNHKEKIVI